MTLAEVLGAPGPVKGGIGVPGGGAGAKQGAGTGHCAAWGGGKLCKGGTGRCEVGGAWAGAEDPLVGVLRGVWGGSEEISRGSVGLLQE